MHIKTVRRSTVSALTVGIVLGILFAGRSLADTDKPTPTSPSPSHPSYAANESGQSFGSLAEASVPGEEPDLTLVIADNGLTGYVYTKELLPPEFRSPEEALEWQQNKAAVEIDVFEEDGRTKIGTFTITR